MPNAAFAFGEAVIVVMPAGLASQSVGYAQRYSLERTQVLVEDGSAALFQDHLTIDSPWVDDDVETIFKARGPFDAIIVRWTNQDDGRLRSACVTRAVLRSVTRRPIADAGPESFSFTFDAISLG